MRNIPEERKPQEEKPYQLEFGVLYGTFLCIACYYPVTNDIPRIVVFLIETLAIKRQHTWGNYWGLPYDSNGNVNWTVMLLPKYGWINTKLSFVGFRLALLDTKIYWYGPFGYTIDGFVVKFVQAINIPHDFTSSKLSELTERMENTIRFPLIYYEGFMCDCCSVMSGNSAVLHLSSVSSQKSYFCHQRDDVNFWAGLRPCRCFLPKSQSRKKNVCGIQYVGKRKEAPSKRYCLKQQAADFNRRRLNFSS